MVFLRRLILQFVCTLLKGIYIELVCARMIAEEFVLKLTVLESRVLRKTQVLDQTREQTRCFQKLQALYTQQDFRNRVNETKVQLPFQEQRKKTVFVTKYRGSVPFPFSQQLKFPLSSELNGNLIY